MSGFPFFVLAGLITGGWMMADIEFDDGLAAALSETARSVADALRMQASSRSDAAHTAATDFSGAYANAFVLVCQAESQDRGKLSGVLDALADEVDAARVKATEERARRQAYEAWQTREFQRSAARALDPFGSAYLVEAAADPMPSDKAVAAPTVSAAFQVTGRSHEGKDGGLTSSADPAKLRSFVERSRGLNMGLEELLTRTQTAWAGFTSSCGWVRLGTVSFLTGFAGLLRESQFDVVWVGHIAQAFEQAGGAGTVPNLMLGATIAALGATVGLRRDHPLLDGLFKYPGRPITSRPPVEDVEEWWAKLSDTQRADLIASVPLMIGNLDGVPISARIEANALTARYFASKPGISKMERTYWESVANGKRTLVLSDPENDRIIEMIGTLTPVTKETITYIPGTGTKLEHFYNRKIQPFSEALVKDAAGERVSFVYKDGPWVTWGVKNGNIDRAGLDAMSARVASFQNDVIWRDPIGGKVPPNATAHSAGLTVTTGAEMAGTWFANVYSLSGSVVMPGWVPSIGTNYHHVQYDREAINGLDSFESWGARTPHLLTDVFDQHIFDGGEQSGVDAHTRIAQGPDTNREVIREIGKLIRESR